MPKEKFRVLMARLTYDRFEVEADSPEEAAFLVKNGKVPEAETDVSWEHDAAHDSDGDVIVVAKENDRFGFAKVLCRVDA